MKELQNNPNLRQYSRFRVHTVDSYQGEENDVILLSLVRSNERMGIGFLENRNRAVVALSRARRGMYMFGNSVTLVVGEETSDYIGRATLWSTIFKQMQIQKRMDIDGGMPVTCKNHGNTVHMHEPGDWVGFAGGCRVKCMAKLLCRHDCPYNCHPFPHEDVVCPKPCPRRVQSCGHQCSGTCGEACYCDRCKARYQESIADGVDLYGNTPGSGRGRGNFGCNSDIRQDSGYPESSVPLWPAVQGYQKPGELNGIFGSPTNAHLPDLPTVTTPQKWQAWDAKAADRALHQERVREQVERGPVDPNSITFVETYKQTKVDKDGYRVKVGVERRTANGYSEEKKEKASAKMQSSAQILAEEFGVITIADGPNTFSTDLSPWERGQMVSPTPLPKRSDALSPTLSIARTVQSKKVATRAPHTPRAVMGNSTISAVTGYGAPRSGQRSSAASAISGFRAPSAGTSAPPDTSTSPLISTEPTSTRISSNSGPLVPGFEISKEGSTSTEPVEEEPLIDLF